MVCIRYATQGFKELILKGHYVIMLGKEVTIKGQDNNDAGIKTEIRSSGHL